MAKYNEIITDIRKNILNKKYTGKLPSLRALSKTYQVNQKTISKVIQLLVSDGIVETRPKSGILIADLDHYGKDERVNNNIALMVRHYGDYFALLFQTIIREIEYRKSVPILIPNGTIADGSSQWSKLLMQRPKAVIIDNTAYKVDLGALEKLAGSVPHIVFIDKQHELNARNCSYVVSDYYYGGYTAVKHLADLNHKRIMLLDQDFSDNAMTYRHTRNYDFDTGYYAAMSEFGLRKFSRSYMISSLENSDWLNEMQTILQAKDRPTAIVCWQDSFAVLLLELAISIGLKVPEDLSIIGYYNTPLASNAVVPLTSVAVKEEEIGKNAVQMALKRCRGALHTVILPELVIRQSTARAKE